jgi:hypothetical protein
VVPPGEGAERELPAPGTRVRAYGRSACVMPYDTRWSQGLFPVRFESGRWAVLGVDKLDLRKGEDDTEGGVINGQTRGTAGPEPR